MRQRPDRRPDTARRLSFVSLFVSVVVAVVLFPGVVTGQSASSPAPDGYPYQAPDGYPSVQVMAEVDQDGGDASSVPVDPGAVADPDPTAPAVAPATPVTQPAQEVAPPPVVAPAPVVSATPAVAPPESPAPVPADDRAVQRLGDDSKVDVAARALAIIPIDWRAALPGWQIRFLPGRAGLRGVTFPDRSVIEIYVRSSDTPSGLAHVVAHELGHAIDTSRLDASDRAAWMAARGLNPDVSWYPAGSAVSDFATPAGDWAESFAMWQTGTSWYSRVGPPPDTAQTVLLAQLAGLA